MFVLGGEASFPAEHFEGGEKRTEAGVFAAAAREAGIKFGIRVNLESISENGELYEKHPEYAMKIPGREPLRVKGRLLLNFADPRVQKYAVRALSSLLSETKARLCILGNGRAHGGLLLSRRARGGVFSPLYGRFVCGAGAHRGKNSRAFSSRAARAAGDSISDCFAIFRR